MLRKKLTIGTLTRGLGPLCNYEINITQHGDFSLTIDGNNKLDALETHPITRMHRRKLEYFLDDADAKAFSFINSSVGWLGITASLFCSVFSSILQQCARKANVAGLCLQVTRLKKLKKIKTLMYYNRPNDNSTHAASIGVFCNARKCAESGQLCHIGGLLLGPLPANSTFHFFSWRSHKARLPVKSIGSAKSLASGEAIDIGKTFVKTYKRFLNICLKPDHRCRPKRSIHHTVYTTAVYTQIYLR